MFDNMIYKMLDTIVRWCECYREYKISKTIPKPTRKELKKWLNSLGKSYK
jgi:hypothetical protein